MNLKGSVAFMVIKMAVMPYIIRILFSSAIPTDEEKEQVAMRERCSRQCHVKNPMLFLLLKTIRGKKYVQQLVVHSL